MLKREDCCFNGNWLIFAPISILLFSLGPALRPVRVMVLMCLHACFSHPIYFIMMDVLLSQYTSDPQYFLQIQDPL